MKKEETITYKVRRDVFSCDNCGKMINDAFDKTWIKGAFQCGVNSENQIATWCSEKCYKTLNIEEEEDDEVVF